MAAPVMPRPRPPDSQRINCSDHLLQLGTLDQSRAMQNGLGGEEQCGSQFTGCQRCASGFGQIGHWRDRIDRATNDPKATALKIRGECLALPLAGGEQQRCAFSVALPLGQHRQCAGIAIGAGDLGKAGGTGARSGGRADGEQRQVQMARRQGGNRVAAGHQDGLQPHR